MIEFNVLGADYIELFKNRISLVNKDLLSLAVTSQTPFPALTVSKSEGEGLFIIGLIYA